MTARCINSRSFIHLFISYSSYCSRRHQNIRYASAVYVMAPCLCICPSVRHNPVWYRNDWTNRAGFALELPSSYPTLHYKGILVPPKIMALPSGTLPQTMGLENFATACRWRYQQNSSTVELVNCASNCLRVVDGRTQFITRRSTVTLWLRYFDLLWICCSTWTCSCTAVD